MSEVRLCSDRRTERQVAVKCIDRSIEDPVRRSRFLREARIQAQLDHPTIVPVYDIGLDHEGREYFTMKRAVGATLEEVIEGLGSGDAAFAERYTLPVLLGIFRQVCRGVEYAHSRGIIHRDLKPANMMVGEFGETYLLDWGIAKVAGDSTFPGPASGRAAGGAGTPGYMAPEQMESGDTVDARADVYALGAILFELLTLEPLHPAEDVDSLIEATQTGRDSASVRARRPDLNVPPELERACVQATQTDPGKRFATVTELLAVVGGYLDGDRDLAYRRALAEEQAQAGDKALSQLLADGDPGDTLRAAALRKAGHALALDPGSALAMTVMMTLMSTPPATLPAEAAAALEQQEAMREPGVAGDSAVAYVAFLIPSAVLLWLVDVTNWWAIAWMVVPFLAGTAAAALRARGAGSGRPPMLALGGVLLAICATSVIFGPFLIMPGLLAGYVTAGTATSMNALERPRLWFAMCGLGVVVPIGLSLAGLLPVGFEITEPGRIVIQHRITEASPTVIMGTLVGASLMSVLAPVFYTHSMARRLRELRERLVLHLWHVKQLGPREVEARRDGTGSLPPPN